MKPQKPKFKQTEIGMIPEEWEVEELEKHATLTMGQSPESIYYNSIGEGTLFLQGIKTFGDLYPKYDTWTTKVTKLAKKGSVLLSVRAPVGEVNIADKDICIGRGLMSINGENNTFIFYLFKAFKNYVVNRETGTVYGSVTRDDIAKIRFPFPPLPEQRAIAKVLSDLDAKIELNQQMNRTLEAIGQAIFKHWFIDFEFPNEEGEPYKSSGGEMVYNEELGKEIPKGWSVINIEEVLTFVKGIEPGYKNYSEEKKTENYLPFFRVQDIAAYGNVPKTFVDRDLLQGKTFNNDDILISLDGTIGRVFIGGQGGYSSGIRKVVAKEKFISKSLIFFFLKSAEFQDSLELFSGGETTIKHVGGAIKNIKFVFKKETCEKFAEKINSIFEKMLNNISEIQTLSAIRDSLLPKLMSGKISVPVEVRT
jgi:type I restriction enzyme S subunit